MSICNSVQRREMILNGLHKLEDRDTMKTAIEELHAQIQVYYNSIFPSSRSPVQTLDADGLPTVITALCRIDRSQKNYARRESVRLLSALATEECPCREAFLSSHLLAKATKFLLHVFSDRDGSVREVAAETFAFLAKEWSAYSGELISGDSQNLFMKRIFKSLSDPKREVQVSACDAFGMMSHCLAPLQKDLIKDILRFLKNPSFYVKANLLQALASFQGEPQGILKSSLVTFKPFVVSLLGQQGATHRSSYGLLHLISSPDWFTRKASVDTIRAIAVLYGADFLESNKKTVLRIRERLQRHRFDRVKPVRDAVHQTIEIYEELSGMTDVKQNDDLSVMESISEASGVVVPREMDDRTFDGLSIVSEQVHGRSMDLDEDQRSDISHFRTNSESEIKQMGRKGLESLKRNKSVHKERASIEERSDVKIYVPKKTPVGKGSTPTSFKGCISTKSSGLNQPDLTQLVHDLDQKFGTFSASIQNEVRKLNGSIQSIHQKLGDGYMASASISRGHGGQTSRPSTATSISKSEISSMGNQDLDLLYQKALSNQIDFFRILQRTGPVISQLSVQTAETVFEAFCWLLSERRGITRILPWIWQLTEQEHHSVATSIRPEIQEKLLRIFAELRMEEIKEWNQIQLLECALQRLWSSSGRLTPDANSVQDETESLYAASTITEPSPSQDQIY
eukprot:g538.t1